MPRGKRADGSVNKMEAVRQAVGEKGKDVTPAEIVEFVKERFQAEMSKDMASTYKSSVLKKMGKRGRKKHKGPAAISVKVLAKTSPSGSVGNISLDDIRAVRDLAVRLGAEKVRQLAEVLEQ